MKVREALRKEAHGFIHELWYSGMRGGVARGVEVLLATGAWSRWGLRGSSTRRPAGHPLPCTQARGTRVHTHTQLTLTGNTTQRLETFLLNICFPISKRGGRTGRAVCLSPVDKKPQTQLQMKNPENPCRALSNTRHNSHLSLDKTVRQTPENLSLLSVKYRSICG